jgi:putative pyoverdin transport system ATP-binding/permease protein
MEIGKLIAYLLRMSRNFTLSRSIVAVALGTGLISGLALTAWLAVISSAVAGNRSPRLLWAFIALCIVVPASRLVTQSLFNGLATRAVLETRIQSCRHILAAPLRRQEELGPDRLFATLTDDITTLASALTQIPVLAMQSAIVITCLAYMGWLSWRLLLLVVGFMVVGALTYGFGMRIARQHFRRVREEMDALFGHLRALVYGAKELKLHRRRRLVFVDSALAPTSERIRHLSTVGNNVLIGTTIWGAQLFLVAIGLIVFAFGGGSWGSARVVAAFTLCLLYMLTPMEAIFQLLPAFTRAAAAMRKLDGLGIDLASQVAETAPDDAGQPVAWRRLTLEDVAFQYAAPGQAEHFGVGPLNLDFDAGETVFLTGGNGSGKSTVAKLLTGLYVPDQGRIRLDGEEVGSHNRESYRQLFAAIFGDFYLFDNLLGLERPGMDEAARGYLVRLQLDKKVRIENGVLSTLDLSQGQRKRLALLTAYMERRPIYFFDEWAADQDPQFKAVFYRELLPELKAMGKTVFVISHDDQYYDLADRLIKMKDGVVEWDRRPDAARMARHGAGAYVA